MRQKNLAFIFCFSFLMIHFSMSARANDGACPEALAEPVQLIAQPTAVTTPKEYPAYGFVVGKRKLRYFPEGRSVYIIERSGEIIWSPSVPSYKVDLTHLDKPIVVSHRSLTAFQRRRLLKEPDIVASGEFIVTEQRGHSVVQEINNRSSTYPGDRVSLELAIFKLKEKGLPIDTKTLRVDFSRPSRVVDQHVSQEQSAFDTIYYHDTLYLQRWYLFSQRLYRNFPISHTYGVIDTARLREALEKTYQAVLKQNLSAYIEHYVWVAAIYLPNIRSWGVPSTAAKFERADIDLDEMIEILQEAGLRLSP